ncbi:hypothetical protein HMPREF0693_2197 [Proteus mirabilis ATCC 29906]|nr:hypothetical protein HMPREF0693_2197 [Proteus mirabilis ATCC 29906]
MKGNIKKSSQPRDSEAQSNEYNCFVIFWALSATSVVGRKKGVTSFCQSFTNITRLDRTS